MSTAPRVTVRRAALADLESVVPLFDAYRQFYDRPSDPPGSRAFIRERLSRGDSTILVAEDHAGAAVGFVQLYPSFSSLSAAPILILNDLFVAPPARRLRVASVLLEAAADHGRAGGAVRLTLSTGVSNDAAQALYERMGWARDRDFQVYNLELGGPGGA